MEEMFRNYPDVVTIGELQRMLGIGRNSAYALIAENKIKHFKVGKSIKIPKVFIYEFIKDEIHNV